MLRTASLITDIREVPHEWIFEHYLTLPSSLTGQDVKIKSAFNLNDKTPSMFVFYKGGKYSYKDFSTGMGGDSIDLVEKLFTLRSRSSAVEKILRDYSDYVAKNKPERTFRNYDSGPKFKVVGYTIRGWITLDQELWTAFKIGTPFLNEYLVKPLDSYVLEKDLGNETKQLVIEGLRIYGFFKKDGTLYKIYQPGKKEAKYVNIKSWIQGYEQLTFTQPYLLIMSSIKDMGSFKALRFSNVETIAPESENSLISEDIMYGLSCNYQGIAILMDNDTAGHKSMINYKEAYGLPSVYLNLEEDVADMVKVHGIKSSRLYLKPLLQRAFKNK